MRISLHSLAALTTLTALAVAQTIVVPNGLATTEGNSSTAYPWARGTSQIRVQYIYDSPHFTAQGITYPVVITRLRWRANTGATNAGGTYGSVQIQMSTCPVDQAAVTTTFASNHGPDLATVYNGPVTVLTGAGTTPNNWYVDVPLSTPFVYDPTLGDLNVDVATDAVGWVGAVGAAVDCQTTGSNVSRVYNLTNYQSPTGTTQLNVGLTMEVTYNPASGLYPNFTATPTSGASPLNVQFTDTTFTSDPNGILSWAWDFDNDGIVDSNLQNPTHIYTQCGVYSVRLTVTDALHGAQSELKTNYIATDNITASFTFTSLGGGTYQFTDTTTPTPTSWAWDLDGDNVIDSTAQNPTFTYPAGCAAYTPTLTATLACRSSTTSRTVNILAAANSLTTLTTGNNGLTGANVGVFYDLTVLPAEGVSVCGLSVLPYSTTGAFNVNVYVTPGTHVGNTSPASRWRLVGTGSAISAGGTSATAVLTDVAMTRPFYLPQGSYGVAVYILPVAGTMGHAYVTGTATNQNYGNADLQFVGGGSTTSLFPATLTTPRVWCGRIHYNKNSQTGDAGYGLFGLGCAGSQAVSTNVATALPRLGQTMTATLNNLPVNAAFFVLGFSNTTSGFGPLPLDLTPFGAPGCFGRVSPDAVNLLTGAGGSLNWNLTIPNNPIYLGNMLYTQGIVVDPGFNSLGGVMSDAAAFIVGQ